jgi:hypothetical protein
VFLSVVSFPSDAKAFCGANITQRFHVFIVVIFEKNSRQNWQTKKSIIFCHRIDPRVDSMTKKMENHRIDPKGLISAQKG